MTSAPTPPSSPTPAAAAPAAASNFLLNIVTDDLQANRYQDKRWAGKPGPAAVQQQGQPDPARIRTRFPPEPNGYLHIGHAKSICVNFGLARDFGGVCHLRFDDTNPEKEDQEYVDAIIEAVHWLGFDWKADGNDNLYFASDYFGYMYEFAEALIEAGHAYVDAQSADEIRANRGTLTEPGVNSPWRDRPAAESLALLREMRDGKHPDGSLVLRAKINMASPNINLRDPVMYRVRHAHHHRTGDKWCIYPMYSWAHPVEDALEGITHSVCTLEFEDQRPFYDWILARLAELGKLAQPLPRQYEFARLNLSYIVTSKRKLLQLVREGHVDGWDDPACRPSSACAAAATPRRRSACSATAPPCPSPTRASTTACWSRPCATTWIRWPRARWRCWTRSLVITNYPRARAKPARRRAIRTTRGRPARIPADARTLDRARRLPRGSAEEVLPPVPRQHCAPEVRLRGALHRLHQERGRRGRGSPGRIPAGHQERHAGRRQRQGQGQHHLGQRRACRARADPSV